MTTKKECLIYMRTSTLTNVKGDSVKRQKSSIMKWVKSNGYIVKGEYWDVESGSKDTMDRPEFMRMISELDGYVTFQVLEGKSRRGQRISMSIQFNPFEKRWKSLMNQVLKIDIS